MLDLHAHAALISYCYLYAHATVTVLLVGILSIADVESAMNVYEEHVYFSYVSLQH